MKLNNKNEHPEEGKLVFLLNDDKRQGFVGVGVFKNGNWYTLPGEDLIDEIDFYWIDLIDQPERSKREDSKYCKACGRICVQCEYLEYSKMRCSEHEPIRS
jgi:hypothetical protein